MMKLAVFVMAVAIAATTVLSALPTSPERPMRTRIVKKVSGTPPASSNGAKITPGGSRTVDGSGSTVGHRTTHLTKNGEFGYMRPVSPANDGASFMLAKRREVRLQKFDSMSASEATTHKDHHAQEEAASLARKRELMSAEEVAVDKDRHAQAEAESLKKRRTSMTPGELAANKDRHAQQRKAQTARNQVRAQAAANRRNEPDMSRQQEEDAAKK